MLRPEPVNGGTAMLHLYKQALCVAIGGMVLSWTLLAGDSPLSQWLAFNPGVTNVASAINFPTILFAMSGFPGTSAPSNGTVVLVGALQWSAYGLLAAWLWNSWPGDSCKPDMPE